MFAVQLLWVKGVKDKDYLQKIPDWTIILKFSDPLQFNLLHVDFVQKNLVYAILHKKQPTMCNTARSGGVDFSLIEECFCVPPHAFWKLSKSKSCFIVFLPLLH